MAADLSWILDRMPHRPPMRLIDEVRDCTASRATCVSRIDEGHVLLHEGRVSPMAAIELFAQAAAALMIFRAGTGGEEIRSGKLLGTRRVDLEADGFEVGDELVVTAEEVWSTGHLSQLQCAMHRDGRLVASGSVNVGAD